MTKNPILILHGWNLSGDKFLPLKIFLNKKGYDVHAPDLPGFGSNKNLAKSHNLNDYAAYVKKYSEDKKLKKFTVIGHSFGGRIAIRFAAKYKNNISALILTGTPGYQPDSNIKVKIFLVISKIGNIFFSVPVISSLGPLARKILYKSAGSHDYEKTGGYLRETFKTIIRENLEDDMMKITQPTLLVWGGNDKLVPSSIAKRMNKTIKSSKLVIIKDTRHNLPYANPELFYNSINKFLE